MHVLHVLQDFHAVPFIDVTPSTVSRTLIETLFGRRRDEFRHCKLVHLAILYDFMKMIVIPWLLDEMR